MEKRELARVEFGLPHLCIAFPGQGAVQEGTRPRDFALTTSVPPKHSAHERGKRAAAAFKLLAAFKCHARCHRNLHSSSACPGDCTHFQDVLRRIEKRPWPQPQHMCLRPWSRWLPARATEARSIDPESIQGMYTSLPLLKTSKRPVRG